jgi:hypothetical protein
LHVIENLVSSPAALLLLGPGLMLLVAAAPAAFADRRPRAMGQMIQAAALVGLLCTLAAALAAS